ncbi:hypothetical protein KFE98_19075 [bacterium SCSIO 12741]|nr:hypothetical protein KFE98_19075 [bacterium SCSIO 12741]
MFWSFRERIGNGQVNKALQGAVAGGFLPLAQMKSLLIILDPETLKGLDQKKLLKVIHQENAQTTVHFLCFDKTFKPTKTENGLQFDPQIISPKEVGTWLKPKADKIPKVDVFVDLTESFSIPMAYSRLMCQAKFHCGREQDWNKEYLDLMIGLKEGEGPVEWVKHWIHYMKLINNNNHAA